MRRRIVRVVLLLILIPGVPFVVLFSYPALARGASLRVFGQHRDLFSSVASDFRLNEWTEIRAVSEAKYRPKPGEVVAGYGQAVSICRRQSCPPPTETVKQMLNLGIDLIYRIGSDVYFVRNAGLGYEAGIASFQNPPLTMKGTHFEYEPVTGEWYYFLRIQ